MAIMQFHIMIPPLTMGQLSLIIAIFPFCYVSYPILKAGWNSFKHKNLDMDVMYSMGILVAFVSSVLGTFGIVLDSSFMFYESAVMLPSFLTIGRYLEARAKRKTSSSIKELIGLQPKTATLVTTDESGNSIEKEIDIEDIEIGNILLVKPGEKIPADSIVVDGESYVDEAMITGEPVPKLKKAGINVFSGTINQDGALKVEAQKIGSETVLSQIIQLVEKAQGSKPPVQRLANRIVSWFIPVILTIAIIVFLLWYFVAGSGLLFALTCLISILVVACPCALGLATPTAVTVGVGRAAEYGILIKNGETLESSKDVDVCVFDKTGTITEGKPDVADIIAFDGDESKFLQILSSVENNSNHPIAKSILSRFKANNIQLANEGKEDLSLLEVDDFENITGKGLKAKVNIDGEMKTVFAGNLKLMESEGVEVSEDVLNKFNDFVSEFHGKVRSVIHRVFNFVFAVMPAGEGGNFRGKSKEYFGVIGNAFGGSAFGEPDPESHPKEAEDSDDDECHLPSECGSKRRDGYRGDECSYRCSCVEYRCRECAVLLREIFGSGLDRSREVSGLSEGKDGTCREEEPYAHGRYPQRCIRSSFHGLHGCD